MSRFADLKKGGGFEYSGSIIPVETYPQCARKVIDLASTYDLGYSAIARIIGRSHSMMFSFAFTFNRAHKVETFEKPGDFHHLQKDNGLF